MKTCHICQLTASLPRQQQKKLQPIPPPSHPWKHIEMDLVCELPESVDGYKHILVLVCYLSKYVVARPLKSKISEEVVRKSCSLGNEFYQEKRHGEIAFRVMWGRQSRREDLLAVANNFS